MSGFFRVSLTITEEANVKANQSVLNRILFWFFVTAIGICATMTSARACTRAIYLGSDNTVITGRTMDWSEDMHTNLWIFPRGEKRSGVAGPNSITWTSKYGSVISSTYEIASTDGMNEKGLVANALYLAESDYGTPGNKPTLSLSIWTQYVLDNFATVNEAVEQLRGEPFRVVTSKMPNGMIGLGHLAISDPTGDSAIFEYIKGQLVIHHGRQYQVLTNSPTYDEQLALNAYWETIGGMTSLPGTISAADRFVRASFFIKTIPKQMDKAYANMIPGQSYINQAVAGTMSVMRTVSTPLGISVPNKPNVASTLWRTVSDQKNKVYYFDSATSPNTFWVDLNQIDFSAGTPVKRLALDGAKSYAGNAGDSFRTTAKPFEFMKVDL